MVDGIIVLDYLLPSSNRMIYPHSFFSHVSHLCTLGRENMSPPCMFGYGYDLVNETRGHAHV